MNFSVRFSTIAVATTLSVAWVFQDSSCLSSGVQAIEASSSSASSSSSLRSLRPQVVPKSTQTESMYPSSVPTSSSTTTLKDGEPTTEVTTQLAPYFNTTGPCKVSGSCVCTSNYKDDCNSLGEKYYNNSETCIITANYSGTFYLTATDFDTETYYDKLIVDGNEVYEGGSGPFNYANPRELNWSSDHSIRYSGWKLCLTEDPQSLSSTPDWTTTKNEKWKENCRDEDDPIFPMIIDGIDVEDVCQELRSTYGTSTEEKERKKQTRKFCSEHVLQDGLKLKHGCKRACGCAGVGKCRHLKKKKFDQICEK